jgi:hypothetical protein
LLAFLDGDNEGEDIVKYPPAESSNIKEERSSYSFVFYMSGSSILK